MCLLGPPDFEHVGVPVADIVLPGSAILGLGEPGLRLRRSCEDPHGYQVMHLTSVTSGRQQPLQLPGSRILAAVPKSS